MSIGFEHISTTHISYQLESSALNSRSSFHFPPSSRLEMSHGNDTTMDTAVSVMWQEMTQSSSTHQHIQRIRAKSPATKVVESCWQMQSVSDSDFTLSTRSPNFRPQQEPYLKNQKLGEQYEVLENVKLHSARNLKFAKWNLFSRIAKLLGRNSRISRANLQNSPLLRLPAEVFVLIEGYGSVIEGATLRLTSRRVREALGPFTDISQDSGGRLRVHHPCSI
ncbi:hypothetical protein EJ08DRAFT_491627 [Tothia fuscella]|uniref:F-box domain-containing protein n=1 Tax=Tothia fuscella TaxID=1048955 RepID=A0A9P4NHS4_9PEZI|nr:hypothetical protein EJ08DRAFT_491627 [Tothia fuscella]